MKPQSNDSLDRLLARWSAPEPPPGLSAGVWARIDGQPTPWYRGAWVFRAAALCTILLWLAVVAAPLRDPAPVASESLTAALVLAGGGR